MGSIDNLKNLRDRSADERKAIARKGGLASAEKRAKAKTLKEELTALLESGDTKKNICAALVENALSGNVPAIREIGVLLGERAEKTEVESKSFLDYGSLSWHEKELVADLLVESGVTGLLSLNDAENIVSESLE